MTFRTFAAAAALGLAGLAPAHAGDFKIGSIEIDDAWVRASVPGQANGAGYMEIENDGKQADRLLEVRSDAAERIELHTIVNENGMAQMRQVNGIDIPANGEVKLAPGGYHVMFLKLKAPFKTGETVPATLRFERAGEVAITFEVKPPTYRPGGSAAGHAGHGHGGHGGHGDHGGHKH